jgi:hypothetical protein
MRRLCVFPLLPFSNEEIDAIVLDLPNDKAPRPDGFNGHLVNKTGHIISRSFILFALVLFHHEADIKSLNYSYITVVPKKENPKCIND